MSIAPISKARCAVYVDGYNWYHAIFRHHPEWKWLNVQSFFEGLRLDEDVVSVKVFSALVDPHIKGSSARARQESYFRALKTLTKVKIILGVFRPREVTCRASCRLKYTVQEEKKTDVNMAVELISDAIGGSPPHRMCIVSGDSDIQPAVEWIAKNRKEIKLTVYVPCLPEDEGRRRTDHYVTTGLKVDCKFLPISTIPANQLGDTIKLPDGNVVVRPYVWK